MVAGMGRLEVEDGGGNGLEIILGLVEDLL